jgi:hypothetical protein
MDADELAQWLLHFARSSADDTARGCAALALLSEPHARAAACAAGAVEAVTLALRKYSAASANLAICACAALANLLLREGNSATRAAALRAGALEAVVAAMRAHVQHPDVQLRACDALYQLGVCHSQPYFAACTQAGASDALLRVLHAHAGSELAPRAALLALGPLTADLDDPVRAAQLLNGGTGLLTAAVCDTMQRFSANELMQYFGVVVLNNLVGVPLTQQHACGDASRVRILGALPLLVQALRTHPDSVRIRFAACSAIGIVANHDTPMMPRHDAVAGAAAAGACEAVVAALLRCCGHCGACACGGGDDGPDKNDARACDAGCTALCDLAREQPGNAARCIAAGAFPALVRVAQAHLRDHDIDPNDDDEVLIAATVAIHALLVAAPEHAPLAAAQAGVSGLMAAAIATHRNERTGLMHMACAVLTSLPSVQLRPEAAAEAVPAAAALSDALMSPRCRSDNGVLWSVCRALSVVAESVRAAADRTNGASEAEKRLVLARLAASTTMFRHPQEPDVRCVAAAAVGAVAYDHDSACISAGALTTALMCAHGDHAAQIIIACADALAALAARCAPATVAEMARRNGALRELEAVARAAPRGSELATAAARAAGALRSAADAAAAAAAAELLAEEDAAAAPAGKSKSRRKKRGDAGSGPAAAAPPADADADALAPPAASSEPAAAPAAVPSEAAPSKSRRRRGAASRAAASAAAALASCEGGARRDTQQMEEMEQADAAGLMPQSASDDAFAAAVQDALAALAVQPLPLPPPLEQLPTDEPAPDAEDTSAAAAPDAPPAQQAAAPPAPDAGDDAPPPARRTAPRAYKPPMGAAPPPVDGAAPSFLPPPPAAPPSERGGGGASGACGSNVLAPPPAPAAAAAPAAPLPPPPPMTKECVVCLYDVAQAELRLLLPCAHRCVCEPCADALLARQPPSARTCPLCVAAVTHAIRIFDI